VFALLTGVAMLIRPVGIGLVAVFAYVLLRRWLEGRLTLARAARLGIAGIGVPAAMFGAWRAYVVLQIGAAVPENLNILLRGYAGGTAGTVGSMVVGTLKNMLAQGGGLVFGHIDPAMFPSVEASLWAALVAVWLPVAIALAVRGAVRAEPLWAFVTIYLAIVAAWPLAGAATARLCTPIAPFLVGLLLWSWQWLGGAFAGRSGALTATALVVAGVTIGQSTLGREVWRQMRSREATWTARLADLERARERFDPRPPAVWAHLNMRESVYVFNMPTTIMEFGWNKDPGRWEREIEAYEPSFVVVPTGYQPGGNTDLFVRTLCRVRPGSKAVAQMATLSVYQVGPAMTRRMSPKECKAAMSVSGRGTAF
jgi:hypothetical protein